MKCTVLEEKKEKKEKKSEGPIAKFSARSHWKKKGGKKMRHLVGKRKL